MTGYRQVAREGGHFVPPREQQVRQLKPDLPLQPLLSYLPPRVPSSSHRTLEGIWRKFRCRLCILFAETGTVEVANPKSV